MVLDDCTPYPCSYPDAELSMELSARWARRCAAHWSRSSDGAHALFGIVQGSVFTGLRTRSAEALLDLGLEGFAVGGLSVGEPKSAMFEVLEHTLPLLPDARPRYLMGVGTPRDIVRAVALGVDMFDCVLPTRNARNGCLFTSEGRLMIKNAAFADDERPPDPNCSCLTCRRYSRAYLRHLYVSGEYLSATLNTMHNVTFYLDMMGKIRDAIASKSYGKWLERMEKWPE
jgi:queuine tRNA-ribosyltransferase